MTQQESPVAGYSDSKLKLNISAAIVTAQRTVYQRNFSWYFLHTWHCYPDTRPYVAYARDEDVLVAINSTVDDYFWDTINNPRTDRAYIESIADQLLTADGKSGAIRTVLDAGGWPILMNHLIVHLLTNTGNTYRQVVNELGHTYAYFWPATDLDRG